MNEDREWTLNNVEQICVDTKNIDEICYGLEQLTIFATENIQNFATSILKLNSENQQLKSTLEEIRVKINELYEFGQEWHWDNGALEEYVKELMELIDKGE